MSTALNFIFTTENSLRPESFPADSIERRVREIGALIRGADTKQIQECFSDRQNAINFFNHELSVFFTIEVINNEGQSTTSSIVKILNEAYSIAAEAANQSSPNTVLPLAKAESIRSRLPQIAIKTSNIELVHFALNVCKYAIINSLTKEDIVNTYADQAPTFKWLGTSSFEVVKAVMEFSQTHCSDRFKKIANNIVVVALQYDNAEAIRYIHSLGREVILHCEDRAPQMYFSNTIFHAAAFAGAYKTCNFLLHEANPKTNVNEEDNTARSALSHLALLQHTIGMDADGRAVSTGALRYDYSKLERTLRVLLSNGAYIDKPLHKIKRVPQSYNDKKSLGECIPLRYPNARQLFTALQELKKMLDYGTVSPDSSIADKHIEFLGTSVNAQLTQEGGDTLSHIAAQRQNFYWAFRLLQAGANFELPNNTKEKTTAYQLLNDSQRPHLQALALIYKLKAMSKKKELLPAEKVLPHEPSTETFNADTKLSQERKRELEVNTGRSIQSNDYIGSLTTLIGYFSQMAKNGGNENSLFSQYMLNELSKILDPNCTLALLSQAKELIEKGKSPNMYLFLLLIRIRQVIAMISLYEGVDKDNKQIQDQIQGTQQTQEQLILELDRHRNQVQSIVKDPTQKQRLSFQERELFGYELHSLFSQPKSKCYDQTLSIILLSMAKHDDTLTDELLRLRAQVELLQQRVKQLEATGSSSSEVLRFSSNNTQSSISIVDDGKLKANSSYS